MIRAVQEFLCAYGRCREVQLADGGHYPVLLSVAHMSDGIETLGGGPTHAPALRIQYRGHKEDLIALGCISRGRLAAALFGRHEEDPRGAVLLVQRKAVPGRRGLLELSYIAQSRSFAAMLPGVRPYCADWLKTLTTRPLLRLVVDNTRRQPGTLPAEPSALLMQRAAN